MARPIQLVDARTNNLKSISCEIPREKLVLITGPSGSGKSSLVLGTLYAEAYRRVAAPLVGRPRPLGEGTSKVASASGLSFPVAFYSGRGALGRLATLLSASGLAATLEKQFFEQGARHCVSCDTELPSLTLEEALAAISELEQAGIQVLAPLPADEQARESALRDALSQGYTRAVAGDTVVELEQLSSGAGVWKDEPCAVFIDAVPSGAKRREERVRGAVALAEKLGGGAAIRYTEGERVLREVFFSDSPRCPRCGLRQAKLRRESFSSTKRAGRCPSCLGAGEVLVFDAEKLFDPDVALFDGGVLPWRERGLRPSEAVRRAWGVKLKLKKGARWQNLDAGARNRFLLGETNRGDYPISGRPAGSELAALELHGLAGQLLFAARKRGNRMPPGASERTCGECNGTRVRREAARVRLNGKSFAEVLQLPLGELREWLPGEERVSRLVDFGLSYLNLSRSVRSLSGGELQRAELVRELSAGGRGLLFLLDEPSTGLHPQDLERVVAELGGLCRNDSALIVTDHHEQVAAVAEHVIELGPGGGERGGELVFQGSGDAYRERSKPAPLVPPRRSAQTHASALTASGLRTRNLKDIALRIPLGCVVAVCGVSGSGKSTAVFDCLGPAVRAALAERRKRTESAIDLSRFHLAALDLSPEIHRVEMLDRLRLGNHPRSDVGSALGVWTFVQRLFAMAPEARMKGLTAPDFARARIGAPGNHFDALEIAWKGRRFRQILRSTVGELAVLFERIPRLGDALNRLAEFDLGYLNVSQPVKTLSSGEQQRLRLASRTAKRGRGTLFLLDEPTRGLDAGEVDSALRLFRSLAEEGNTVVAIEHRPRFLAAADYLIEFGPGAGELGGAIIAEGTPDEVRASSDSRIAKYLVRE